MSGAVSAGIEADRKQREAEAAEAQRVAEQQKLAEQGQFKTLAEQREAEIATLKRQLAEKDGADLRSRIATEFQFVGENAALADAITGTTEAEMRASAEKLKAFKKGPAAPPLDQGTRPTGPGAGPQPPAAPAEAARVQIRNRYAGPAGLPARRP